MARKISATPASPVCVATRICSTYLDFGAASWSKELVSSAADVAREERHVADSVSYLDLGAAFDRLLKGTGHRVECREARPVPT